MLEEYKRDRLIWEKYPDHFILRSDILGIRRVVNLLGRTTGKKILDLGCGNGKVARMLAREGALVTGVDLVAEQIALARKLEREAPLGITYLEGDVIRLEELPLTEEGYDVALSLMMHLYFDEDQFRESFSMIRKYLKPGGTFIYLNIHPARGVDGGYFASSLRTVTLPTMFGEPFSTTFYHHPLELVLTSIAQAGLRIVQVLEPRPTEEELMVYPQLLEGSDLSPSYLIIEAKRD